MLQSVSCIPFNPVSFAALHPFIALCLTASCCICCCSPHGLTFYHHGSTGGGVCDGHCFRVSALERMSAHAQRESRPIVSTKKVRFCLCATPPLFPPCFLMRSTHCFHYMCSLNATMMFFSKQNVFETGFFC